MSRVWSQPNGKIKERRSRRGPRRKPQTIQQILEMQQPELRKSVLGREPLETHTSNPRRGSEAGKIGTMINALSTEDGKKLVLTARQAIADHLDGRNIDLT